MTDAALRATLWRVVPALGIAQIISWGTLYYAIAVLGGGIERDLATGPVWLYGAFTGSLVLSGLAAPRLGRQIDRHGGARVLTAGSALAGLAFLILANAHGPASLIAGWMIAGLAMAATLYDPAFATLARIAGPAYRTAITVLTLFGGFASKVFWPVSQYLLDGIGWRNALLVYAALHFFVCLPLHAWFVPRGAVLADAPAHAAESGRGGTTNARFAPLAAAFALAAFAFSSLSVHLIAMLKEAGMAATDAVWIAAMIGPMQVVGRVGEITLARGLRPTLIGGAALSLLLAALALLPFVQAPGTLALAFAMAYGISNGIMTIARGTVPVQLFGHANYGETLGRLARVMAGATALAPLAVALLLAADVGYPGVRMLLVACLVFALASYRLALPGRATRA